MLKSLVVCAGLVVSTAAFAESYDANEEPTPTNRYVVIGSQFSVDRTVGIDATIEGGGRIGNSPTFVHGELELGRSGGDGSRQAARVGAELRGCVLRNWACSYAGVDTGLQHQYIDAKDWFSDTAYMGDATDALVVPRVGVELGEQLKLRLGAELPVRIRLDEHDHGAGLALQAGLGFAF